MAKRKRKKLTDQEKEQRLQIREIRNLMKNMGFERLPRIDGKEFVYKDRTSELDDIFYYENILIIGEYTVISEVSKHLLKKKIIYDKINESHREFIKFLYDHPKFTIFKEILDEHILNNYTINQIQIRIFYASKQTVSEDHKSVIEGVCFFDYPIVKYFESIARVIKKSTKYEFLDFLEIPFSVIGENIKSSSTGTINDFSGHILPEEHSSFKDGYKLVSFYIDAKSLIKRAFVLRKDGWRNMDNIGLYQRMFVSSKIRSMRKYLNNEGRVFINNIIVTLPVDKILLKDEDGNQIEFDESGNFENKEDTKVTPATIQIKDEPNLIGIIDGQHRTYAYHEGNDVYEESISKLREIQNLLVTGIIYPKDEHEEKRLKFEAKLFLEINSNQSGASSQLKQEIEFMMNPFSSIAISKYILNKMNSSGPLATMFEEYWFERLKIKTASIISFGLKPLVKLEGVDSLFHSWSNTEKEKLKSDDSAYELLQEYKNYCTDKVRDLFRALREKSTKERWKMDRTDPNAMLNVTSINGVLICLRLLIENGKNIEIDSFRTGFDKLGHFNFKGYKSSQYRKMGEDIYAKCFE